MLTHGWLDPVGDGRGFPVDVAAGAGLGLFIGSALNLVFGVPSASTAGASG